MTIITVVITCYNEGEKIYNAINSLKQQTFQDFEIILVNDSSTYLETNNVCVELEKQNINVLYTVKNLGLSGARNLGIEKAKGNIIVPLDADDTLPSNAIKFIFDTFKYDENIDFIFGNYFKIDIEKDENSIIDCSIIRNEKCEIDPKKLLQNWIFLGTSPFKKSLWKKIKGYSLEFSNTCQDVDFLMKAILINAKSQYINQVIYNWNKSELGMNNAIKNKLHLDKCCYNNIEFFELYAHNYMYIFYLCKKFNDMNRYKYYFSKKAKEKNNKLLFNLIQFIPVKFLPYFSKLV